MNLNIIELFQKGGIFMYPLLILSALSIIIIIERIIYFSTRSYRFRETLQRDANGNLSQSTRNPLSRVILEYKSDLRRGEEHSVNLGTREASRQVNDHMRGLKFLATIGAISPLIGLLGTVWGMVKAFAKIAELGDKVTPGDFAGGIWAGLLTTVAGLLVAIPAVTASRVFESRVDKLSSDLNELASHLKERYYPS